MEIQILFFARARELAGETEMSISLPEGATVADAMRQLAEQIPELGPILPSCRAAVDEEFAVAGDPLHDSAVLAVLPPVSGG